MYHKVCEVPFRHEDIEVTTVCCLHRYWEQYFSHTLRSYNLTSFQNLYG